MINRQVSDGENNLDYVLFVALLDEGENSNFFFILWTFKRNDRLSLRTVSYREGFGGFKPPTEIPKGLQNRAKLNQILKTVNNWLNLGRQHPKMFGKKRQ